MLKLSISKEAIREVKLWGEMIDNLSMLSILRGSVERMIQGTEPLGWSELEIK